MIPSFSIMGIPLEYENMAKQIQEYSRTHQHLDELPKIIIRLVDVCCQAFKELQTEYQLIASTPQTNN